MASSSGKSKEALRSGKCSPCQELSDASDNKYLRCRDGHVGGDLDIALSGLGGDLFVDGTGTGRALLAHAGGAPEESAHIAQQRPCNLQAGRIRNRST